MPQKFTAIINNKSVGSLRLFSQQYIHKVHSLYCGFEFYGFQCHRIIFMDVSRVIQLFRILPSCV